MHFYHLKGCGIQKYLQHSCEGADPVPPTEGGEPALCSLWQQSGTLEKLTDQFKRSGNRSMSPCVFCLLHVCFQILRYARCCYIWLKHLANLLIR